MRQRRRQVAAVLLVGVALVGATLTSQGGATASPRTPGNAHAVAELKLPAAPTTPLGLVPAPVAEVLNGQSFAVRGSTRIVISGPGLHGVASQLQAAVASATGSRLRVVTGSGSSRAGQFSLRHMAGLAPEGYRLIITNHSVDLAATTKTGLFRGVQTLRQLLPAGPDTSAGAGRTSRRQAVLVGVRIDDHPQYSWRAAMLDVSRHFFGVSTVKRYIDQLALSKINVFHLHLSDDQGWRIAVNGWPRLTSIGGGTQVGGGPGGFYSQAQYRELVRYAATRFITIVPEIDLPGHTNAALASYSKLNCDGKATALYTGTEVGFSSLCVRKDITYTFLDDVIRQLAQLTPGRYLHIGGDEALSTSAADYAYFMTRLRLIVAKYGKQLVGWEPGLAAVSLDAGTLAQYWDFRTDPAVGADLASRKIKIIMSPANKSYLDMKYNPTSPYGTTWAGYVTVRDSYDWNPTGILPGVGTADIAGVEAPLWTEGITNLNQIEFQTYPRLPAIAELGWSPAASHSWDSFRQRVGQQGPLWRRLGISYYPSTEIDWR